MENHILFYSNYCNNCKEFVSLLYKSPFFEKFQKICVDNNPKIPKEITLIPCIVVPRMNKPLVGTEAFHWLRGMNQMYLKEQEEKITRPGFEPGNPLLETGLAIPRSNRCAIWACMI